MLNRLKEQFLPTRASHEAVRGQRPYHSTEPHAATTTHAHPPRSSTTAASPAATSASAMHERRSMHRPTTCSDLLQQREATRLRHASNSAPSMPGSDTCTTSSTTTSNNDAQSRRSAPPCDTLLAPATQRKGDSTDTHNSNTCHTDATADDELGGVHAFPHVAQLRGVRPRSETCKTSHLTHPNNTDKDDDDRVVVSDACEVLVSSGGRAAAHQRTPPRPHTKTPSSYDFVICYEPIQSISQLCACSAGTVVQNGHALSSGCTSPAAGTRTGRGESRCCSADVLNIYPTSSATITWWIGMRCAERRVGGAMRRHCTDRVCRVVARALSGQSGKRDPSR